MSLSEVLEATVWGIGAGISFAFGIWLTARSICTQSRSILSYLLKFLSILIIVAGMYSTAGCWQVIVPSFVFSAVLFLGAALLARRRRLG